MDSFYRNYDLSKNTSESIIYLYSNLLSKENETKILNELIEKDFVPTPTEQYLFDDYGLKNLTMSTSRSSA